MDSQLTQARGDRQSGGFSLIELVLVVAILSVLSVAVGLSVARFTVNPPGDRQRFLALDKTLRQDALMTRHIQEMRVWERGFARARLDDDTRTSSEIESLWNKSPDWVTPAGPERRILYLPDGRNTPLTIDFRESSSIIRCTSAGWAGPICKDR